LQLVSIAPFAVFNLVAGASHLGFRQFIVGSLLGLAPGLGAITLFSDTLWAAVTQPTWANVAITAAAGFVSISLPMLAAIREAKWWTSGGMSSRRARSGGTVMGLTLRR
jgi:uncharacterized membrane protein YdjX (TVP38/TMEM64 family)